MAVAAMTARSLRTICTPLLKIHLHADLDEASDHHDLRNAERAIGRAFGQHGAGVQRVVDVEIERRTALAESEHLADAQIELIDAIAVERAGGRRRWRRRQRG